MRAIRSNSIQLYLIICVSALVVAKVAYGQSAGQCASVVTNALAGSAIAYDDILEGEHVQSRVEAALACLDGQGGEDTAKLLDRLTSTLYRMRRHEEALLIYDRFFHGLTEDVPSSIIARMYMRRAAVYGQIGRQRESIEQYSRAAALDLPSEDRYVPLYRLGRALAALRDYSQAHRYYSAADSLIQALVAHDSAQYSIHLGEVRAFRADAILRASERSQEAMVEATEQARPLILDALNRMTEHPAEVSKRIYALDIYGRALRWEGNYEASLAAINEADRLMNVHPGSVQQSFLYTLKGGAGWSYFALGRYDEAGSAFRAAYEAAKETGSVSRMMGGLRNLAFVAEAQATNEGLREAERLMREAAILAETERESLGLSEWSASAHEVTRTPYLALIRILVKQGRTDEALLAFDEMQARHLRDLRSASARVRAMAPAELARFDSLTRTLHDIRYRLGDQAISIEERSRLQGNLTRLQREREQLTGGAKHYEPLSIGHLQRQLAQRNQTLLAYAFAEDYPVAPGSGYALAFLVKPDTVLAVMLPTSEFEVRQVVDSLSVTWDDARPAINLEQLHRLYTQLVAPLAPFLTGTQSLSVIPTGPLARVPFGLLVEKPPSGRFAYRDAAYLLRQYPITTELAPSLITDPRPIASTSYDMLALGRSQYDGMTISTTLDGAEDELVDLPNVRAEVESLHRLVQDGEFVLDQLATETFFRAQLGRARTIHIAGHALVDPDQPMYSQVVLAPSEDQDGVLHLYELQDLELNADLVTLSGCGTARGIESPSEGMMGLQYAFRAAGAGATLATLWQVEDAAMVDLMERFYRNLKRGLPKDRALQQAQIAFLEDHHDLAASPFFWGAPALYGNPGSIDFEHSSQPSTFWVALGLLLVIAGIVAPQIIRRQGAVRGQTA